MESSKYEKFVYDRDHSYTSRDSFKVDIIRNLVGNPFKKKILDVGCGDGEIIQPFVENNDCYGVDISETMLKQASSKGIKTYLVDLEKEELPFASSFFDIVVASHVLEHVVNTDSLLSNINRVLKKGSGSLIVSFPNINSLASLLTFLLDIPPKYSARYRSPHVRDFTLRLMKYALQVNGFKVERVRGTCLWPFRWRLSRYLAGRIPRLADRIVLKATKVGEQKEHDAMMWDVREVIRRDQI